VYARDVAATTCSEGLIAFLCTPPRLSRKAMIGLRFLGSPRARPERQKFPDAPIATSRDTSAIDSVDQGDFR